ncbi:glycosyltransferase family 4 protein [Paraburkholderia aspalathi]|nr:glycosyltransferase family 4 protein [Paraburkholderia aspalathi]
MKNILIISEFFSAGGLETQLRGQAHFLKRHGFNLHIATSSGQTSFAEDVFQSGMYGLPIESATAEQLLQCIEKISTFIAEKNIDVVHAHPFFSFIIGMAVAHTNKLPLIATIHGPASFFADRSTISGLMLNDVLFQNVHPLIVVSKESRLLARAAGSNEPLIIPNGVAIPRSKPPLASLKLPWLWAGRLDNHKLSGLQSLITEVIRLKENVLHIYGQGPEEDALRRFITERDPNSEWISCCGWDDNVATKMQSYSLIAGMGRVILEGAAANRPCLLVGYDGIRGLLTPDYVEKAAYWNFSGRGIRSIDSISLDVQLKALKVGPEKFGLYEWAHKNVSEELVWNKYLDALKTLTPFSSNLIEEFVNVLEYAGSSEEIFWNSSDLFNLLRKLLSS